MWPFNQRRQQQEHQGDDRADTDTNSSTRGESFEDDQGLHHSHHHNLNYSIQEVQDDQDGQDGSKRVFIRKASSLEDFPYGNCNDDLNGDVNGNHDKTRRRDSFVSFAGDIEEQIVAAASSADAAEGKGPNKPGLEGKRSGSMANSRRSSVRASLRQENEKTINKATLKTFRCFLVTIVLPCLLSIWYCAAIFFPPGLQEKYSLILWDKGRLEYNDKQIPILCPPESPAICSEGLAQLILIGLARISAFASYVFMGVTFISKMHFTLHFLSSSYLRRWVPFESLHNVHTTNGKIFCALALVHTVAHYARYILRRDASQLQTRVHITGLIAILSMVTVILSMSSIAKRFKNSIGKYERRLNAHWIFVVLCIALILHHGRTRVITLIFFGLWSLDYLYGIIFATYSLEVVELLPLSGSSGVQMLFRNPDRFNPKSGEYIKVQFPWLRKGGNEWHPFSIYLRESTVQGFRSVYGLHSSQQLLSKTNSSSRGDYFESAISLKDFIDITLMSEYQDMAINEPSGLLMSEARADLKNRYPTTQVFINPVGDWSRQLLQDVQEQKQLRACWVRGPYKSPYSIAQNFSHLVLTASGIGITPALGVMGQYAGNSRTKILIWLVRDADMLKFFAPLIQDAHLAVVFYTGKEKLKWQDVRKITSNGNIFIQQSRPESLTDTIGGVMVQFENHLNLSNAKTVKDLALRNRTAWCILYCGGSIRIRDDLRNYSKSTRVQFECEMFDW